MFYCAFAHTCANSTIEIIVACDNHFISRLLPADTIPAREERRNGRFALPFLSITLLLDDRCAIGFPNGGRRLSTTSIYSPPFDDIRRRGGCCFFILRAFLHLEPWREIIIYRYFSPLPPLSLSSTYLFKLFNLKSYNFNIKLINLWH